MLSRTDFLRRGCLPSKLLRNLFSQLRCAATFLPRTSICIGRLTGLSKFLPSARAIFLPHNTSFNTSSTICHIPGSEFAGYKRRRAALLHISAATRNTADSFSASQTGATMSNEETHQRSIRLIFRSLKSLMLWSLKD